MYEQAKSEVGSYEHHDLFMGFHCGNTSSTCMASCSMNYQIIMHRLMEPGKPPNITRGTLEGLIRPGDMTIFRLQSTAEAELKAFVAEGEILNIDPKSFGCIAVFAVKEMARFYRYALLEKRFPHHTAVAFAHNGPVLWNAMKLLGITDLSANLPKGSFYPTEYPGIS
jgi:L-fucose isomerase-like protein